MCLVLIYSFSPSRVALRVFFSTDWALLNTQLNFVYLDPVLASHLQEQADLLIGRSLLAFVHPDEQASAEQDLGGVLDSRTLHGSVTRYVQSLSDCSPCLSLALSLNYSFFSPLALAPAPPPPLHAPAPPGRFPSCVYASPMSCVLTIPLNQRPLLEAVSCAPSAGVSRARTVVAGRG